MRFLIKLILIVLFLLVTTSSPIWSQPVNLSWQEWTLLNEEILKASEKLLDSELKVRLLEDDLRKANQRLEGLEKKIEASKLNLQEKERLLRESKEIIGSLETLYSEALKELETSATRLVRLEKLSEERFSLLTQLQHEIEQNTENHIQKVNEFSKLCERQRKMRNYIIYGLLAVVAGETIYILVR